MSKRTLIIVLLTGLILSACGGAEQVSETPTSAPTNTPLPTNTSAPTDTPAPVETLTPEPTVTEVPPNNPPDCTNSAAFVSDVTIPDNTQLTPAEAFTKTWRVRNTGTCIWWSGYTLSHYSEQAMSAPGFVTLPLTNPGDTADISIDLIAPNQAGTYRGNFVIKNPSDLIMQVDNDSRLWLIIDVVGTPVTATATGPTPTGSVTGTVGANVSCNPATDATRVQQVATVINAYRKQNSLASYTLNAQLSQAAQAHANDMACTQLLVHEGSDGSTPKTRVEAAEYTATGVTENIYGSNPPLNADQVVNWWKVDTTDPNHNLNMISTKYTEFGVGYAFYQNYGYYVVVFAVP